MLLYHVFDGTKFTTLYTGNVKETQYAAKDMIIVARINLAAIKKATVFSSIYMDVLVMRGCRGQDCSSEQTTTLS